MTYIAEVDINYKNQLTKAGKPFVCDDEKIIKRLVENGKIEDINKVKKSTKVKLKKRNVRKVVTEDHKGND